MTNAAAVGICNFSRNSSWLAFCLLMDNEHVVGGIGCSFRCWRLGWGWKEDCADISKDVRELASAFEQK